MNKFFCLLLSVVVTACSGQQTRTEQPTTQSSARDSSVADAVSFATLMCDRQPSPAPEPTVTREMQQCNTDADCTSVRVGCCDHCNGGRLLAVSRANEAALQQSARQYNAYRCPFTCERDAAGVITSAHGPMCTALACAPMLPVCQSRQCTLVQGRF